ncbi:Gfo/Idh/MocA family protein [Amphibacillus sp. Q70]|uniref:Gfo/Idh/MocA family protein n=1 Tax=Amphibacillus sp. Q70 TaxID=3453416 RepID=UPI003F837EDA
MTIHYGIISTAQIVPRFVAGVKESQDGEVTAIASRNLDKAEEMAARLAIPHAYGSYQELYEDENVDVVYVATYNKGHYDAAKQALLAGKHVLVEKPFVLKQDQAEELFDLAKEKNLFLMEAQKALFLPITKLVRETIQLGKIGAVKYLRSVTSYPSVDHISWFHSLEAGGGALHGSGSYPLQYMMYVINSRIDEAAGTAVIKAGQTDSQFDLSLLFDEEVQGNIFITVNLDLPSQLIIYGEKGKIIIPYFWKTKQAEICIEGHSEQHYMEHQSEFVFEIDHVNECLKQGLIESPTMTKEMTLQTVELVEKLYQQWTS